MVFVVKWDGRTCASCHVRYLRPKPTFSSPARRGWPQLRCGGLEAARARARARGHYRGGAAEVQAGGEEEGFSEDLMFFVATYLSELTAPSSQDSSFRPAWRLRPDGRGEVCVRLYLHSWGYYCFVSSLQLQGQVSLYLCELLCMVRLRH